MSYENIRQSIEKTERDWKLFDTETRIKRIRGYIEGVKNKEQRTHELWWYDENLRLLDTLTGDKLDYLLEVHHRLIMLHIELDLMEQYPEEYTEEHLNIGIDKTYEACTFEEKYNRQYGLAQWEFIEDGDDDFTDIEEFELYCYEGEPMDIMIKLMTLEGEELKAYLETLPPIDLTDEVIDDGMTPAERRLQNTMDSIISNFN